MPARYYRLCFNTTQEQAFDNSEAFSVWCRDHLMFNHRSGGYVIKPWHETPKRPGVPMWNVLVEASTVVDNDDLLCRLGADLWKIGGVDVLVYVRYESGEETLLSVR